MDVTRRLRRRTQLLFQCEKELQREHCFVEEECRSQFGKKLTGTNFEGGALNTLPGTVPLLVQYS